MASLSSESSIAKTSRKKTRDAEGSIIKRTEERRTSNGKTRKETVYYARVRYTDNEGKKREKKRRAGSYNDAAALRRQLQDEIKNELAEAIAPEKPKTFFELLDHFEKKYVKEAKYVDGNKVSGQRDPIRNAKGMINDYKEFFGDIELSKINYFLISKYKEYLEITPFKIKRAKIRQLSKEEKQKLIEENPKSRRSTEKYYVEESRMRKPATVNRNLSRLRRIFSVGVQIEWITQNPFKFGDALISPAVEETRTRVCSFAEEARLLEVCVEPRAHLKDIIICAIDTFLRESELFSLTGSNIDFDNKLLTVIKTNAKTGKERQVPLTERVLKIFEEILHEFPERQNSPIFGLKSIVGSWYTALKLAGLDGLRFHDLRATGITRCLDAGIPASIVMKFSGHEKFETFQKYVRSDIRLIKNAGDLMSEFYKQQNKNIKTET